MVIFIERISVFIKKKGDFKVGTGLCKYGHTANFICNDTGAAAAFATYYLSVRLCYFAFIYIQMSTYTVTKEFEVCNRSVTDRNKRNSLELKDQLW